MLQHKLRHPKSQVLKLGNSALIALDKERDQVFVDFGLRDVFVQDRESQDQVIEDLGRDFLAVDDLLHLRPDVGAKLGRSENIIAPESLQNNLDDRS